MEKILKSKRIILALMVASIIFVAILLIMMTKEEAKRFGIIPVKVSNPATQDVDNNNYDTSIDYESIKDVFESYRCKYLQNVKEVYYVKFAKDVFDEEGRANTVYFESLIHSAAKNLQMASFVINDEEKCIMIKVLYNKTSDTFSYTINNISGYFSKVNFDAYKQLADISEVKLQTIRIKDSLLKKLNDKNMYVINELGSGNAIKTDGEYSIFMENTIKTRNYNGKTRNIIYYNDYPEEVFEGIKVGTPINIIIQKYPNFAFKGDDYVGYRTDDFYVFFYKDEISIYPYSYKDNSKLLTFIEEYILDKDLAKLDKNLRTNVTNFDYYDFDEEAKNLTIHYPANGIMIDIKQNNPSGIVVYNNFYISERLKKQVSEGKIKIELYKNSIEEEEKARINN